MTVYNSQPRRKAAALKPGKNDSTGHWVLSLVVTWKNWEGQFIVTSIQSENAKQVGVLIDLFCFEVAHA